MVQQDHQETVDLRGHLDQQVLMEEMVNLEFKVTLVYQERRETRETRVYMVLVDLVDLWGHMDQEVHLEMMVILVYLVHLEMMVHLDLLGYMVLLVHLVYLDLQDLLEETVYLGQKGYHVKL